MREQSFFSQAHKFGASSTPLKPHTPSKKRFIILSREPQPLSCLAIMPGTKELQEFSIMHSKQENCRNTPSLQVLGYK